ncbi:hypothetical protein OG689_01955 [Kitasatospora sp. NBC_00240]|uniref:hypothetical protein n=1 Tax=Kitasatospora sp. NBC_00240 TaxID=2903567 RepID=UPI0022511013|nr:hypothetical protein [Kitasatospora sp. NBC_00240]MCX5208086.1 hypothetical protein [Kitasatospora sp. NBC_00240]
MSEPVGVGEPQEQPGAKRPGKGRAGRWVRGRSARWVAAGAAVVVIGGGAAAAAIHHEEEGRGDHRVSAAGDRERFDGRSAHQGRDGERADGRAGQRADGPNTLGGRQADGLDAKAAPAPLPSLGAADAVAKASAAVADGRVESLTAVAEQGGGRAWRAVVVGPDGVRHVVTVDGASGTVTGNTVLGG